MRIRITNVPAGEAPEDIRRAWIGLELPVSEKYPGRRSTPTSGVLSGPKSFVGRILAALSGRIVRRDGYVVPADAAVAILEGKSPAAAGWWRQNVPHGIKPGRFFVVSPESCVELP